MEETAILAGIALGIAGWCLLVRFMKANGSRWWVRHGVGLLVGPLGVLGVTFVLAAMAGVTGEDDGEPLGVAGVIAGLTIAAPMLVPLFMLWRRSHNPVQPLQVATTAEDASPPRREPQTPISSTPQSPSTTAQMFARLQVRAERFKEDYQAELVRQKQKAAEKERARATRTSSSGNLKFVYEDAQGNTSVREVTSWADDGEYIEGHCLTAGAVRTFRRDRVIDYLAGEDLLGPAFEPGFEGEMLEFPEMPMEVLFTGIPAEEREELEDLAIEAGMVVRTRVTQNLHLLVTGPRAGPTKVTAAREKGLMQLTVSQFRRMLETGEVPA